MTTYDITLYLHYTQHTQHTQLKTCAGTDEVSEKILGVLLEQDT